MFLSRFKYCCSEYIFSSGVKVADEYSNFRGFLATPPYNNTGGFFTNMFLGN
jgi:hypothetical protein